MRTPYRWGHIHLISWSGLIAFGLVAALNTVEKRDGDNLLLVPPAGREMGKGREIVSAYDIKGEH